MMITQDQINQIQYLERLQDKSNRINNYIIISDLEELTYSQAREAILTLKYFTGAPIDYDDLDATIYNEVGVICG